MATFTPEQEQAIFNHDKNMIVVAGAGSGKTRVLVERYLDLLDKNRSWDLNTLVAITFTREAAHEMRHRVRKELEQRVQHPVDDLDRHHWSNLLKQMDSARIDTIHAMCATILRANAAEALIDPAFQVLEPLEATALLADIIDAELQALATDDHAHIARLFSEYDMRDIRAVLTDQALLARQLEPLPDDADQLYQRWQVEWQQAYCRAAQAAAADLDSWLEHYPLVRLPDGDKLTPIFQTIHAHYNDLKAADAHSAHEACQVITDAMNLRGGSKKNWGSADALEQAKAVLTTIRERLKQLALDIGSAPTQTDHRAAHLLVAWYHLLNRIQHQYRRAKAEQSYLDFNDLEQQTAALLRDNQAVRERYQASEFKRLLVDEFQDTNQSQWDIVRHLASLDQDVALFLVGDPKQSIYAFRGADVSVFDHVRQRVADHPQGIKLGLTQSFRAHPGLIEAFNQFFSEILTRDAHSPVAQYEIEFDQAMSAFRQQAPDPQAQHYAPLELLIQRNTTTDKITSDERHTWEAYEIAQRLKQLRTNAAPIHDKQAVDPHATKAFDYGDAALLFQSTSHITTYERVFKALGIPFVTLAGRGYYNRQEVWDMLNILKALHNPADNLALAAALRSPMFAFSDDLLLTLRLIKTEDDPRHPVLLWQALAQPHSDLITDQQRSQVTQAHAILSDLRQLAGRVTIAELLRTTLARTGYLAILTGLPDGARLRRNVEKLVEIAENSGKITLGAFTHYLNDLTSSEVREGEATLDTDGVVRFMTVHASKGLEFPVVVLADAAWTKRGAHSDVLIYDSVFERLACKVYDPEANKLVPSFPYQLANRLQKLREAAERKRLLYVAATRARDCLIISGEMTVKKSGDLSVQGWLGLIADSLNMTSLDEYQDGQQIDYLPTTPVRLHLPTYNAEQLRTLGSVNAANTWQKQAPSAEDAHLPPLMQPIAIETQAMMGHIAATQLADLGGYHYSDDANYQHFYRSSLRRHVLDDAPAQIREVIRHHDPRIRPRQLGEVVHEALRYWRFPDQEPKIDDILRAYAWQQQITDQAQLDEVVQRARHLLEKFQQSDLYQAMAHAKAQQRPFYAELPFIYRTDKRIIHGVIDALFQHDNGEWWLVDYKTSTVRGGISQIEAHARRYYLQVGAYASAVRQELKEGTPRVFIHYIQYNHTLEIPTRTWETDIQRLEAFIGEVID